MKGSRDTVPPSFSGESLRPPLGAYRFEVGKTDISCHEPYVVPDSLGLDERDITGTGHERGKGIPDSLLGAEEGLQPLLVDCRNGEVSLRVSVDEKNSPPEFAEGKGYVVNDRRLPDPALVIEERNDVHGSPNQGPGLAPAYRRSWMMALQATYSIAGRRLRHRRRRSEPLYASWLNRIEAQFTALRYFALDGTDHESHRAQEGVVRRYIAWRNRNAQDKALREIVKCSEPKLRGSLCYGVRGRTSGHYRLGGVSVSEGLRS